VTHLPDILGGGGAGGLFMKWNGVDASQFEPSPAFISPGWSAPTLVAVADATAPSGFVLRLEVTADAGVGSLVWLLNTTPDWEPTGNDNRSFEAEIEVTMPSSAISMGVAFLGDDVGNYHGYGVSLSSANSTIGRIDDGVEAAAGSTVTALNNGPGLFRWNVSAGKQAGAPPTWVNSSILTAVPGAGSFSAVHDSQASIGGAPGASWNNLACDRVGLIVITNFAATHQFDMRAINFSLKRAA